MVSLELYKAPIRLKFGVSRCANSMIFSADTALEVPVTLPPGFSRLVTSPDPKGSAQTAKKFVSNKLVFE